MGAEEREELVLIDLSLSVSTDRRRTRTLVSDWFNGAASLSLV